jgi:hypothetical protein
MSDYLNGVEILGTPKTVRLEGKLADKFLSGPLEVWVSALVATLDADQRVKFATIFEHHMRAREGQQSRIARVVSDIPMPNLTP